MQKCTIFAKDYLVVNKEGRLAEGLGTGLQNLLLRFKSGSDLKRQREFYTIGFPFLRYTCKFLLIWNTDIVFL